MEKKIFLFFLTALFLVGCAEEKVSTVNTVEVVSQPLDSETLASVETLYHPEKFTDEQKAYVTSWWGEGWENGAATDWMVESALLGSGIEAGHRTEGIARGFSYEGDKTDIPESAGNGMLTLGTIEKWVGEGKDFRLKEIAPYQHTTEWRKKVESAHQHPADCDKEFFQNAAGFRICLPVDYSVWPCEMVITGGVTDDRIVVTAMMVTFGDQKDRCGGSVYQHMNFIRTVLKDEDSSLEHVTVDVMAGSADTGGCYLTFTNNTDKGYTVPEEALVDGKLPVSIMEINGKSMGGYKELPAYAPEMNLYAEWDSLERGEHELAVELIGTSGSNRQVTVPFVY